MRSLGVYLKHKMLTRGIVSSSEAVAGDRSLMLCRIFFRRYTVVEQGQVKLVGSVAEPKLLGSVIGCHVLDMRLRLRFIC